MDTPFAPRVVSADRFHSDLVITFADQRTARFPAAFLYAAIPQVEEILETGLEHRIVVMPSRVEHPPVPVTSACELMRRLTHPFEVLGNLTYLAYEDAEIPEKVRLYMRMAQEQLEAVRRIASKMR